MKATIVDRKWVVEWFDERQCYHMPSLTMAPNGNLLAVWNGGFLQWNGDPMGRDAKDWVSVLEPEAKAWSNPDAVGCDIRYCCHDPIFIQNHKGEIILLYAKFLDTEVNFTTWCNGRDELWTRITKDGGRTWERMCLPLSFADEGPLPAAQNGVGDPSILYDHTTHRAWIVAAWCHGMGYGMAWNNSAQGMDPDMTGQLVLAYSDDDGKTWSEPINITRQVKRPEWHFLLQGPGRGITMRDGTRVFPTQYIDAERMPHSAIMYSRDSGRTWHMHLGPRANTTEAQVAELPDGTLMLNMRDNRGGSRAVAVTDDLGATWSEHISSRKALREPVCMASLISVPAGQNISGRDILLFSNPDSDRARRDITIKISFDGGCTWPAENQVLLDGEDGWGYSCLTMIDPQTVGILYESSQAHITFQAIPLEDLMPR